MGGLSKFITSWEEYVEKKSVQKGGYNRKQTIDEVLSIIWLINTLPIFIVLFFFSSFGIILSFPLTFIAWIFFGDRPVHRMQPLHFFIVIFWATTIEETTGTPSMRGVFQFFCDLKVMSDYRYSGLYDFFILGKTHPVTGYSYPLPARMLALVIYGLSTYAVLFVVWCLFLSMVIIRKVVT
jgi:hypothetical protein